MENIEELDYRVNQIMEKKNFKMDYLENEVIPGFDGNWNLYPDEDTLCIDLDERILPDAPSEWRDDVLETWLQVRNDMLESGFGIQVVFNNGNPLRLEVPDWSDYIAKSGNAIGDVIERYKNDMRVTDIAMCIGDEIKFQPIVEMETLSLIGMAEDVAMACSYDYYYLYDITGKLNWFESKEASDSFLEKALLRLNLSSPFREEVEKIEVIEEVRKENDARLVKIMGQLNQIEETIESIKEALK